MEHEAPAASKAVLPYANPLDDAPPGSRAACEWTEQGVTFTLPPEGIFGSIVAALVLSGLGGGLALGGVALIAAGEEYLWTLAPLLLVPAGLIGAIVFALVRGIFRPTVIQTAGRKLTMTQPYSLTCSHVTWDAVWDVGTHLTGITVGMRPVGTLYIRVGKRSPTLLSGRDLAELRWIARGLRQAIGRPGEQTLTTPGPPGVT